MEFIRTHATGNENGGRARGGISVYGQESNYTTWRLAKMNLAIRDIGGIEGRIVHGDSFHDDRHLDLRADFILANPPVNVSDWGGERLAEDKRWRYGVPPPRNANFAWVQHIIHYLAPAGWELNQIEFAGNHLGSPSRLIGCPNGTSLQSGQSLGRGAVALLPGRCRTRRRVSASCSRQAFPKARKS